MTQCKHFRMVLYAAKERCLDDRVNFGGLDSLPCVHENNSYPCEGHEISERDKPRQWQAGASYEEVVKRSQRTFGDNPNQE